MKKTMCGVDCDTCYMKESCKGCCESEGKPFGQKCMVAVYCEKGGDAFAQFKQKVMDAFNALQLSDMPRITELYALRGALVNLEYPLPGGQKAKFWHDDRIYLGCQVEKTKGERCYGLTADEEYLMVSEYGVNGADPEVIVFKRWQK